MLILIFQLFISTYIQEVGRRISANVSFEQYELDINARSPVTLVSDPE
jgi:hypothetical protein